MHFCVHHGQRLDLSFIDGVFLEISPGHTRTIRYCDCEHALSVDEKSSLPPPNLVTQEPGPRTAPYSTTPQSQQPPEQDLGNVPQEQTTIIHSPNPLAPEGRRIAREELQPATEIHTASTSTVLLRERGFLLMCVNTAKFMTELSHIETTYLGNDYVLFSNIRANYEILRGSPLKFWSLYHPTSARFVRFELVPVKGLGGSFVGGIQAPSLPPPELVLVKKQYRYAPCSIETEIETFLPELGFWHQFYNPHTCAQLWWMARLPTKFETELKFNPGVRCLGWGVHIEETLNMAVVTTLSFTGILISYFISVSWSVIRKDVSGGFGIGSFLISIGAFILGIVIVHQRGVI